jgi:exonuclease SbcC
MKIFKVSFKNINNLKGENSINFDEEPLSSAGIFAITGPTGSGKSTILDVVTLALFNKIPRFKGSISKNAIEGLGSVITHHTTEAYARIEYEIRGQRYTSEWITKNTKAGKFVDYEMFIYDVSGKPLDLKKSEVPGRNEEIIGLKYSQFVKSIILSQGQFAKFLKADKDERGQLLENLTGSSIYRKIGIATYDKWKNIKLAVTMEKDRLENISCLSDEDRENLKLDVAESEKQKEIFTKAISELIKIKTVKSEIEKLNAAITEKKIIQKKVLENEHAFELQKTKLDIYDRLSPMRGEMTRYQDAIKLTSVLSGQIESGNLQLNQAQKEYQDTLASMTELTGKQVDGTNFSEIMSAFEKEINTIDQELKYIIKKGTETRNRIGDKIEKSKLDITAKAIPEAIIPTLEEKKDRATRQISNAGLEVNSDLKMIRVQLQKYTDNLNYLKDLNHTREHEKEVNTKLNQCEKNDKIYQQEILKYKPIVETTNQLVSSIEEKIELLKKQKQDKMLIASLSDHRSRLVDGTPCPLCGSEEHPWSAHEPKGISDIDKKIEDATRSYIQSQSDLKSANKTLTTNQANQVLNAKQLESLKSESSQIILSIKEKVQNYEGSENIVDGKLSEIMEQLKAKIDTQSKAIESLERLSVIDELLHDFRELKLITTQYKTLGADRKSKFTGENVSQVCNELQDKNVNAKTRVATYSSRLEAAKKSLAETNEIVVGSKMKLEPIVTSMGFADIQEADARLISEEELTILKSTKDKIIRDKTAIETELKTLYQSLETEMKNDGNPEIELDEIIKKLTEKEILRDQHIKSGAEKSALLKKDDEDQLRLKNKANELQKLTEKLEKWDLLNKMIGDAKGNKFANFAQGLTLQNLLVFANRRLKNLSDRYLLNKPVGDGPLTVLDQYQGNIQRSVTTLSGGESFLISLALALSLSDMASKNVKLESLFIDEGFGTLDQDTLEIAMNTLEKLQTESQKTVGVISHVETLKERINVQIKLQKDAMGYSSILVES